MGALLHHAQTGGEACWEMALGRPDERLAGTVIGDYVGWHETRRSPSLRRELPKLSLPVILNLGAPYEVYAPGNGPALQAFGSFLAGAHDNWALTRQQSNSCLQFNLSFTGAYRLLRLPMDRLVNRVLDLDALLPGARALVEELGNTAGWEERFRRLDAWLLRHLEDVPAVAPEALAALERIQASGGQISIGAVASAEGVSRKRLIARCHETLGLGPKRLARLVRFQRALSALQCSANLAEVALDAGFCDQAHFNRDFHAFAGQTPGAYLAAQGKNVQDGEIRPA